MTSLQVLLVDLPKILEAIILAKFDGDDTVAISCWDNKQGQLSEAILRGQPDVLIADRDRNEAARTLANLAETAPGLDLLFISENGSNADQYRFWPERRRLSEPSADTFVNAVHAIAEQRRTRKTGRN